jgi:hypothetical protein
MHVDGWRLRISGHYGTYAYVTRDNTVCQKIHDVGHTDPNPTLARICDSLMDDEPAADREDTEAFLASYGLEIEVSEKLATISGVLSTATHFLLKPYKEQGVLMVREHNDERLAVAP